MQSCRRAPLPSETTWPATGASSFTAQLPALFWCRYYKRLDPPDAVLLRRRLQPTAAEGAVA